MNNKFEKKNKFISNNCLDYNKQPYYNVKQDTNAQFNDIKSNYNNREKTQMVLNSNLNLINEFNLFSQGNVEDSGLDSSWLVVFVWTGKNYKVRYRTLDYIFESASETSFHIDTTSVNYDFSKNTNIWFY